MSIDCPLDLTESSSIPKVIIKVLEYYPVVCEPRQRDSEHPVPRQQQNDRHQNYPLS
jgi:hypothetical protein